MKRSPSPATAGRPLSWFGLTLSGPDEQTRHSKRQRRSETLSIRRGGSRSHGARSCPRKGPTRSSSRSERTGPAAELDAFDADVLIYAAVAGHEAGRRVRALFPADPAGETGVVAGVGSVLLVPELLAKPLRDNAKDELAELAGLLSRLELLPTDQATAELATALAAAYGLRTADAVHLATAVGAGADRFVTNNRSDFPQSITEIDITYPDALPEPSGS